MRKPDTRGAGCLVAFALPFALGGLAAAVWGSGDVLGWLAMRSWVPVPMTILQARLDVSHGDDGETWLATGRYRYRFDGRDYTGERISLSTGHDNVGRFQRDVHREMQRHRRDGTPLTGFVNPDAPDESILYRQLRIELLGLKALFALLFGGVGFGLMALALVGKRRAEREAALATEHPDAPWLWREDWANRRVRGGGRASMWSRAAFAVVWNLVSLPLLFIVPGEVRDGNQLALVGLLFPAVGVGLLVAAVRAWRRHSTYGRAWLQLDHVPCAFGRSLRGEIVSEHPIDATGPFTLSLECVRGETRGRGKDRRRSETVLWQDSVQIAAAAGRRRGGEYRLPVAIRVPDDQPATDGDSISWRVGLHAPTHGVEYRNQFEVPVFDGPGSAQASATEDMRADSEFDVRAALAAAGLVHTPPDTLFMPRFRQRGAALSLGVFTLVWLGAVWLLYALDGFGIFAVGFALFAIPLVLMTLDLVLSWRRVDVADGVIGCIGGWFGAGRRKVLRNDFVRRFEVRRGMQVGSQLYYDIVAHGVDGGRTTLLKGLRSRRLAEHIVAWFEGERPLVG